MALAFCPACATPRVGQSRYCPACAFDFETISSPVSAAAAPVETEAGTQPTPSLWVPAQPSGSASTRSNRRRWPVVILIALTAFVIVVFLGLNGGGFGHPAPTATSQPVISWVPLPGGSGDGAIGVGGSPAKIGSTCGFANAGAGNVFILVGVAYRAGADSLFFSPSEWTLHDDTSTQYGQSLSAYGCIADQSYLMGLGTLNPGLSTRGGILFEIPANATHLSIDWRGTTSGQTLTWRLGW